VLEVLVPGPGGGATQRVGPLSPGGFFGEMSLLTGEPRTATVSKMCASVPYEVSLDAPRRLSLAASLAERIRCFLAR